MFPFLDRIQDFLRQSERIAPFVPKLVTRLIIGQAFLLTGWGKLHNHDGVTEFFTSLHIPFPGANAWFIACVEFVGGIALILGLGTRLFGALLSCTMIVAMLTADRAKFVAALDLWPENGLVDLTPFAYLVFLIWLVAYGPGWLSIDHGLTWWWSRKSLPNTAIPAATQL